MRLRRPSRRAALAWGAGGAAALAGGGLLYGRSAAPRGSDEVRAIAIASEPLGPLLASDPGRRRFGELTYRSGLVLTSEDDGFGGLSSLWRSPDGTRLVALSDNAQWLTALVLSAPRLLIGLTGAGMAPILGEDGVPLRRGPAYDVESFAVAGDGVAYIGIERVHQVRRFADWTRDGVRARAVPIPVPAEIGRLPANRSLEAIAVAPPGHPLAGAVITIAEGNDDADSPTRGWVVTGERQFAFRVRRSEAFNITDMGFLPSGELLLLERHYSVVRGVACRMRRCPVDALRPDRILDGRVIFQADLRYEIDNMEGLAIHRDPVSGETVVTLVSDDNFSSAQRTLLIEFALDLP